MLDLKSLPLSDLLDLLTNQTAYHILLITTRGSEEQFANSRGMLEEIQAEIAMRKNAHRFVQDPDLAEQKQQ